MKKTGNNQFLKQYNETNILNLIRLNKTISRAELSNLTGLSPTSTGVTISSLIEKGYIHEVGIGESKGGRKPVLVELLPRSYYSVGIDVDIGSIYITLIDITGTIIHEDLYEFKGSILFRDAAQKIEALVDKTLKKFSINTDRLLGIGVSVPGMVNSKNYEIVLAPNLGWKNINFKDEIKLFKDVPWYVENESMSSAICENWLGSCQGINDFICINIKSGIGAGIFTGGRLYRGASGSAGEIGHMVVDENGPKCGCGNYGCLETLASTARIVENAKKLVRQGVVSSLNEIEDVDNITIEDVILRARNMDDAARNILSESGRFLGLAISNIINALNPSKIVIGKEFINYPNEVLDLIKEMVAHKALKAPASNVEIVVSRFGEKSSVWGAAIIPLKILFGK